MPLLFGQESDGGGDHNHEILQNLLAFIAGFILLKCDKMFLYKCCSGFSYLNASERVIPLINIAYGNHSACIDPNTPAWLRLILHGLSSMKEVCLAIAEYNLELSRAIQFRREHPLEEDEVSESESVTMDQEIGETPFFPADPRAGAKVKKFVASDGWYN